MRRRSISGIANHKSRNVRPSANRWGQLSHNGARKRPCHGGGPHRQAQETTVLMMQLLSTSASDARPATPCHPRCPAAAAPRGPQPGLRLGRTRTKGTVRPSSAWPSTTERQRAGAAVGQAATLHRYMRAAGSPGADTKRSTKPTHSSRSSLIWKIAAPCPQPATSPAGPYRAVEVGFDIPDRRGT
jgi:hypothetical protein